jgi:Ca2+-binding EF-hand superfamily protein
MKRRSRIIPALLGALMAGFAFASYAADGAPAPDPQARHEQMKARMLEKLKAADTNGDGMISREEANAALPMIATHFDEIDTNKDGFITLQEFGAAMKAMHHRHEGLKQLDKNGDGLISHEEAQASPRLAKHFDAIDTNKDGFLSKDELLAARTQAREKMFARIDTDGDGRISPAEAERFPFLARHFDAIDLDHDGFLTKDELKAAHDRHKAP